VPERISARRQRPEPAVGGEFHRAGTGLADRTITTRLPSARLKQA
jgi:hypothetical protein